MKIDVYSTNTCPPCLALKNWLDTLNIPYTNHDVSTNREDSRYLLKNYGSSVPVIEIDGRGIVGFHKKQIQKRILESLKNG